MSKSKVASIVKEKTGKDPGPYRSVRVSACAPNDWNPNKMDSTTREKLTRGITLLMKNVGHIPPIVVRRHPDRSVAKYQIIDGYHRWDILRSEGFERVDAYILDVDTKTAMILTDTLNYLRGEPNMDDYAEYYRKLINEEGATVQELGELVHKNPDEIEALLDAYEIEIDHIDVPTETDGETKAKDEDDVFIEMKIPVSRGQAEVIERELSRIGALLNGKNIRGRALEFMAVNSSHTPIDNLMGSSEVDLPQKETLAKLKKKMGKKARA